MIRSNHWQFSALLTFVAVTLIGTLALSFFAQGPWVWAIGVTYIAYDSGLLLYMLLSSWRAVGRHRVIITSTGARPSLAVVIAARNERAVLAATIDALRTQSDPAERILIVDDGSTDGSADWLRERYELRVDGAAKWRSTTIPALTVVVQSNTGKARALNHALTFLDQDVVVTIDADTVLEPQALAALRAAFADDSVDVGCGVLTPYCAPESGYSGKILGFYQHFEYLRSFLWRLAWMHADCLILVSGAFAAYRRERLMQVGGFDPDSKVEDYELLFRLHRAAADEGRRLRVVLVARARALTDAPGTMAMFLRQRRRWFAGFIGTMFRHRDLIGARRLGHLGRVHLRLKTVDLLLPVYGLLALAVLLGFLIGGRHLDALILCLLALKFLFDATCHSIGVVLYHRWLALPRPPSLWIHTLAASLTEPFGFQLLRQLGALLGWYDHLRGASDWTPQRSARAAPHRLLPLNHHAERPMKSTILLPSLLVGLLTVPAICINAATFDEALALKQYGRLAQARDAFAAVVAATPRDRRARYELATLQGWTKRYADAIATWSALIADAPAPGDHRALVGRARVRYWQGDLTAATADLDAALRITPTDVDALTLAGDVALARGERTVAQAFYARAQAIAPGDAALAKKIKRAEPPPRGRVDVGGQLDQYHSPGGGSVPGRDGEYAAFAQIGWRVDDHLTLGGGMEREHRFTVNDTRFNLTAAWHATAALTVLARAATTPNAHFLPRWEAAVGATYAVAAFTPELFVYQRHYADQRLTTWAPGVTFTAQSLDLGLSDRYTVSDHSSDRTSAVNAVVARAAWLGWGDWKPEVRAGYGRENDPQLGIAKVSDVSAGLTWQATQRLAFGVVGIYEDRQGAYRHTTIAFSSTVRF